MPSSLFAGIIQQRMVRPTGYLEFGWLKAFQGLDSVIAKLFTISQGTHEQRLTQTPGADGSLYVETDRLLLYIAIGGKWYFEQGVYFVEQKNLPDDLTANEQGFLANVTDFNHVLRWDGKAWSWAPGELGSDYIVIFNDSAGPNPATGWHACDGSTDVTKLNADGTLAFDVTVPNTAGSWYRV